MNAPTIRIATQDEARPIALMSRCLIEVGLRGWSWDPARVARAIRQRDTCVAIAESNHQIVGFTIAEFGDTRVHVSLLAVTPAYQRAGIGRSLVQWLEQSALTAGISEMQLELRANNPGAKFFYQTLGFDLVRAVPGYYCGEETALRMRKQISICIANS